MTDPADQPPEVASADPHPGPGDFLARVRSRQAELSPAATRVVDFLAASYQRAAFMSTRAIAAEVGVSMASVVRAADQLGYDGYDELATAIQDRIAFDLAAAERLRSADVGDGSPLALLRRAVAAEERELARVTATFDPVAFDDLVERLTVAREVLVVGLRWVAPLAEHLRYSLNKVRPNVEAVTRLDSQVHDQLADLAHDPADGAHAPILLAIGFARYPRVLIDLLEHARELGVGVAAITDSSASPLHRHCATTLQARSEVLDVAGTLGAPGALISALVSAVALRRGEVATTRLDEFEVTADRQGTYLPADGSPRRRRTPQSER